MYSSKWSTCGGVHHISRPQFDGRNSFNHSLTPTLVRPQFDCYILVLPIWRAAIWLKISGPQFDGRNVCIPHSPAYMLSALWSFHGLIPVPRIFAILLNTCLIMSDSPTSKVNDLISFRFSSRSSSTKICILSWNKCRFKSIVTPPPNDFYSNRTNMCPTFAYTDKLEIFSILVLTLWIVS